MSDAPALWRAVDDWLEAAVAPADPALAATLARSEAAGLPDIAVAPLQGRLLHVLALAIRAERILEIGTLGGYSTLHLARALAAGGRLVTLERDPHHAETARASLEAAGVGDRVEVRVGSGLDLLPRLAAEDPPPFDLVFIDANKPDNAAYFDWALRLARPGALILVDNVVRKGAVLDAEGDANVQGVRRLMARVAAEPRVAATVIQTVGAKGHDGLLIATVKA